MGVIDSQYQGLTGDISYRTGRQTDVASDPFLFIGGAKPIAGRKLNGFIGLMEELRISNIKRYTNGFLPANAPLISDGNTMLLFHFDECNDNSVTDSSANPLIISAENLIGPTHTQSDAPLFSNNFVDPCVTPTITQTCPTKSTGGANCDSKVDLIDYEIWRRSFLNE